MRDDQFTRLFKAMTDRFDKIESRLEHMATKEQLSAVYDLLDKNLREHETLEQEQAAMKHQLNRLEARVDQMAG